ncbi:MAG: hypothetical protein PVG49_16775 [Desulfobacteraceae bacterium]|jgi:hypothetical protein
MTSDPPIPALARWIGHIILLAAGTLFLLFGIYLLLCAYRLEDPFYFVMTFFASNLVILISATLMVGSGIRLYLGIRDRLKDTCKQEDTD